jgi:L-asparaginase
VAKRIGIYFLGGTIAMSPAEGGGVEARLGPADLLAAVPSLQDLGVLIEPHDAGRHPSASLTFATLLGMLRSASAGNYDGVVIVQGTDTIDETSYFFDLLWPHAAPLVVTGAMRHPGLPGADGPANLFAAVAVAASDDAHDLGALVVMNDQVHAARFVAKSNTSSTAAFVSPGYGPLGFFSEGRVVLGTRVVRRPALTMPSAIDVAIPIYMASLADDTLVLEAAERADGLVVAGSGGGHVRTEHAERLGELARSMPVVITSRTGSGAALTSTYAAVGAEIDLINRGLISGGELPPLKARLLLAVLLANDLEPERIARHFLALS